MMKVVRLKALPIKSSFVVEANVEKNGDADRCLMKPDSLWFEEGWQIPDSVAGPRQQSSFPKKEKAPNEILKCLVVVLLAPPNPVRRGLGDWANHPDSTSVPNETG
jgi:hypothetical protein